MWTAPYLQILNGKRILKHKYPFTKLISLFCCQVSSIKAEPIWPNCSAFATYGGATKCMVSLLIYFTLYIYQITVILYLIEHCNHIWQRNTLFLLRTSVGNVLCQYVVRKCDSDPFLNSPKSMRNSKRFLKSNVGRGIFSVIKLLGMFGLHLYLKLRVVRS